MVLKQAKIQYKIMPFWGPTVRKLYFLGSPFIPGKKKWTQKERECERVDPEHVQFCNHFFHIYYHSPPCLPENVLQFLNRETSCGTSEPFFGSIFFIVCGSSVLQWLTANRVLVPTATLICRLGPIDYNSTCYLPFPPIQPTA